MATFWLTVSAITLSVVCSKDIPVIFRHPRESFEIKLNLTKTPEDVSFARVKLINVEDMQIIQPYEQLLMYESGSVSYDSEDMRVLMTGKPSLGQAWFVFHNVSKKDTGYYGILYKLMGNTEVHNSTFLLNVTEETKRPTEPTSPDPISPQSPLFSTTAAGSVEKTTTKTSNGTPLSAGLVSIFITLLQVAIHSGGLYRYYE